LANGTAILSSTDQLARDLIDDRSGGASVAAGGDTDHHTVLEVSGAELQRVMQDNRAAMVRDNMIKEGKSETEAGKGIDTLTAIVGWFARARLAVGRGERGEFAEALFSFQQP
jgi:hypothetical protein